jgi:hypothetical protein
MTMKKITSLFFLSIALINIGKSQEVVDLTTTDFRDRLMVGLKIGANYSNVYDSKGEQFKSDPKFGLAGGLFLAIPIGRYFGLQPEVLFSQKGFQATGNILGSSYSLTRTTDFIDVPLFFAFKPSEFISLLAGPEFSYLIKKKDVFTNTATSYSQEKEFSNDNIRKNIFGFIVGADITIKHIVLGVRAAWDVQNNNGDGTSSTPRYKNVWYQATIGYRFL